MITLFIEMPLDTENQRVSDIEANTQTAPVSSACITDWKNYIANNIVMDNSNPFILGSSTMGGIYTLENSVGYYLSADLCDSNGDFSLTHSIEITTTKCEKLDIIFDKTLNQYPKTIRVVSYQRNNSVSLNPADWYDTLDDTTYTNDNYRFTINKIASPLYPSWNRTYVKVYMSEWSAPNKPLKVMGIYGNKGMVTFDNRTILSINSGVRERSNDDLPSWGVLANTGDIVINDYNETINENIENGTFGDKQEVIINMIDNNTGRLIQLGKYLADTWEYDNDKKQATITLKDDLVAMQDINFNEITLSTTHNSSINNMYKLYNSLKARTPARYKFALLENTGLLENIGSSHLYLEKGSLWNAWQKFCETCALYMYKNRNNEIVISSEWR